MACILTYYALLTLLNRAHDISFYFLMLLEHVRQVLPGKLGRTLASVSIKNCEACIVGNTFEVFPRHELC